jgi:hypothetical protein
MLPHSEVERVFFKTYIRITEITNTITLTSTCPINFYIVTVTA